MPICLRMMTLVFQVLIIFHISPLYDLNLLNSASQTFARSPESSPALPKTMYVKRSGLPHLKATCLETYSKILRGLCPSSKGPARPEAKFGFLHRLSCRVWISFVVCKVPYFPHTCVENENGNSAYRTPPFKFQLRSLGIEGSIQGSGAYFRFTDEERKLPLTMFIVCHSLFLLDI